MPPQFDDLADLDAVLPEALDDRQGAEGRGLDEGPVDLLGPRAERQADEEAGQPLVDEDGAVAVVPVEGEEARLAGLEGGRPPRQRLVRALASARPAAISLTNQLKMSPTADCPASSPRYPGRTEPSTMPHRPGMSGSVFAAGQTQMSQVRVPMILTKRARVDARADGAEVGVEGADRDREARPQAELLRPLRGQPAGGDVGGVGLLVEAVAELAQPGVELRPGNPWPAGRPRRR